MADKEVEGKATEKAATATRGGAQPNLKWDDSAMTTSYANVVNLSMTREEVGLFFGTNLTTGMAPTDEVRIRLTDRIIMTPYAAKRLCLLLSANLRAYEERYGPLDVEGAG